MAREPGRQRAGNEPRGGEMLPVKETPRGALRQTSTLARRGDRERMGSEAATVTTIGGPCSAHTSRRPRRRRWFFGGRRPDTHPAAAPGELACGRPPRRYALARPG